MTSPLDDWATEKARELMSHAIREVRTRGYLEPLGRHIAYALRDVRREAYAARDVLWLETLVGMADGIQADSGDTYAAEMLRGAAKIVSDAITNGQQAELRALAADRKGE